MSANQAYTLMVRLAIIMTVILTGAWKNQYIIFSINKLYCIIIITFDIVWRHSCTHSHIFIGQNGRKKGWPPYFMIKTNIIYKYLLY